jgi:hypothetical protein
LFRNSSPPTSASLASCRASGRLTIDETVRGAGPAYFFFFFAVFLAAFLAAFFLATVFLLKQIPGGDGADTQHALVRLIVKQFTRSAGRATWQHPVCRFHRPHELLGTPFTSHALSQHCCDCMLAYILRLSRNSSRGTPLICSNWSARETRSTSRAAS